MQPKKSDDKAKALELFRTPLPELRSTLPPERDAFGPEEPIEECARLLMPENYSPERLHAIAHALLEAEQWGLLTLEKTAGYVAPPTSVGKGPGAKAPADAVQDMSITLQSLIALGDACIWYQGRGSLIPETTLAMLPPELQRQLDGGSGGRSLYSVNHKRRWVAGPRF